MQLKKIYKLITFDATSQLSSQPQTRTQGVEGMENTLRQAHQPLNILSNHDLQTHSAVIEPFSNPGDLF